MCKKFYLADWHYGHSNIIGFDNRPFINIDEMNDALVKRWNNAVSAGDLVFVLGDFFWIKSSDAIPVLNSLNGQKFLIKGNHDRCNDSKFLNKFVKVDDYMEVEDNSRNVVLCHYPIPCFKNHFYGWYHLYGHVHSSFEYNMMENARYQMEALYEKQCNMYNCGVMMPWMDYTPRTLDEIVDGYNRFKKWNSNNETN